jgi:hypothetical protein
VGIGLTNPTYQLQLSSTDPRIALTNENYGTWFTSVGYSSANDYSIIQAGIAERLRIDSSGKIIIGNNIPMWSGQYGGALILKGNNATADRHAELTTVDSTGASTGIGLVVKGAGSAINVGIGNDNPQHKFHITHSGTGAIPTDYQMGATSPNDNYQGIHNNSNSATFSGLALETRTSGASRWLIANEWKNTYLGDLVFRNRNGGTTSQESMRIDSSGRVTTPYQPVFFAYNLNFPGSNAAGTASGGTDIVNVGSHYSTGTGRFTAPIAGTYVFYMMTQSYDSGNTTGLYQTAVFRKNGSNVGAEAYHGWQPNDGNNHVQAQNTIIITLAANDYMMAYVQYGSRDIQNYFGGYLLG